MADTLDKIFFEGEVTESVIANLIKNVDKITDLNKKLRNNIKIILIELCTNIISHHSGTAHSVISVDADDKGCNMEVASFVNQNDFDIIEKIIEKLRNEEDLEAYYFDRLANNPDKNLSAKLGLIRVFKICEGNLELSKELIVSKVRLILKLRINDKH